MTEPTPQQQADAVVGEFTASLRAFQQAWSENMAQARTHAQVAVARMAACSAFGLAYDGNDAGAAGVLDHLTEPTLRMVADAGDRLAMAATDRLPEGQDANAAHAAEADAVATGVLLAVEAGTTFGYAMRGKLDDVRRRVAAVRNPVDLVAMHQAARDLIDVLGPYLPTSAASWSSWPSYAYTRPPADAIVPARTSGWCQHCPGLIGYVDHPDKSGWYHAASSYPADGHTAEPRRNDDADPAGAAGDDR